MPYIGRELDSGNYLKLDDISSSFDGSTTTFNLTAGGKAFFPGSAFSILVNLAGVAQEPEAAYQINNSQITFATAPVAGDQFFCIVLGVAHGVNVPGNGTVDGAQLAKPFNYDGYFYLDDTNNRVGVGTATPAKPLHVVGEGQFDSVRVLGDLQVDGTTTTLDTVVTEVDRLEVGANNNTVAIAVTQSGSGDAAHFLGGDVGIGTVAPNALLDVFSNTSATDKDLFMVRSATGAFAVQCSSIAAANPEWRLRTYAAEDIVFSPGGTGSSGEKVRITSAGKIGVGGISSPAGILHIATANTRGILLNNSSIGTNNTDGTYISNSDDGGFRIVNQENNFMLFGTNNTERLRITSAGSVGIGTADPQSQFEVYGSSPIVRSKHSTSQKYVQLWHNSNDAFIDWSADDLILRSGGTTERLRIDSAGRLLLGTTTPGPTAGEQLTIADSVNAGITIRSGTTAAGSILFEDDTADRGEIQYSHNGDYMRFKTAGTERLRIDSNGRLSLNDNSRPASDANEGAQLRVTGTPLTRNQYYSPAGDYFGSFGYTDNTYTKSWIAVDSAYNKTSSVSSGIFLSAFHADAGGSSCGHTIKNVRTDAGGLIFSSVVTGSVNNPAVETERVRITSGGNVLIGKTTTSFTEEGIRLDDSGSIMSIKTSTSTNQATASGGSLSLVNYSATDNNFSHIGGYNSNSLVTSQINFINTSHSSRTGDIAFRTHDGSNLSERLRIDSAGRVRVPDTGKFTAGTGDDLQIYHDGTRSRIHDDATNATFFTTNALHIRNKADTEAIAKFTADGAVELYHNNSQKFVTTSTGVSVTGLLSATTKSFTIDHPTKENYKLRYGSLEGPENGVYVRGRTTDNVIELPDYWTGLVDEDSITVNLTPIGNHSVWIEEINNNKVHINSESTINCFYTVFAERKDVEKLIVEIQEN